MTIDVIDFTQLEKRGLLKPANNEKSPDVIDFSTSTQSSPSPQPAPSENAFDLLSSLAQASSSSSQSASVNSDSSLHFSTLTNKLDDVMYKLETLISRVMQLEARFDGERRN